MINFENSIDTKMFMSMQISKKCLELGENRPVLFLSNPGVGKSTAVELFAQVNGYEEVLLRISNETPDAITGYDVVDTGEKVKAGSATSATHIRPSWFTQILKNSENGKKTVLFLDEITTSDNYVQGAALNLVFDRRCHNEKLPDDTLIVAAGNYAQNLSSEMNILGPMLNRFMIHNIIPNINDLPHFLCKYSGAMTNNRINFKKEISDAMDKLKRQERDFPEEKIAQIGEVFQNAINQELLALNKDGKLDLSVTELKDIYSDVDNDNPVPNFITFRSCNYLLDAAVSCYICFGKAGINSKTFEQLVHGTVGMAISRDDKGEIKKSIITSNMVQALVDAANDIDKLFNDNLQEYQKFFNDVIGSTTTSMKLEDINLTMNKIDEMMNDKDISQLDRPIEAATVEIALKRALSTIDANKYDITVSTEKAVLVKQVEDNIGKFRASIDAWNITAQFIGQLSSIVTDMKYKYERDIKTLLNETKEKSRKYSFLLRSIKKIMAQAKSPFISTIPDINDFKKK
jgi:hypothetical protein